MWEEFIRLQEASLGKEVVDKWLRPLKVLVSSKNALELEAENPFQIAWFNEHVKPSLKSQLKVKIKITLKGSPSEIKIKAAPSFTLAMDPLDPSFSLEHWIQTKGNAFPVQFLTKQTFPPLYNPVYLHGPSGCGKTHLLMALTHHYKTLGLHALYVRAETFTDHVVLSMRNSAMTEFRKTYRSVDVLLFDDVHILARRTATQEEFFHTFNALHTTGKQIILSGNVPQGHLPDIEPRLVSRFEWGMTFCLPMLTSADLPLILDRKISSLHLSLGGEEKEWLLSTFPHMRQLSQALEAIALRLHLKKLESAHLTTSHLELLLEDLIAEQKKRKLSFEKILSTTSAFYGISTHDILSASHSKEYAIPRHIAVYLCRHHLELPFAQLGRLFDRDHSTTMASVKLIEKKLGQKEEEITTALQEIQKKLKEAL